jgi:outer membrane lipoprotein carrier protein
MSVRDLCRPFFGLLALGLSLGGAPAAVLAQAAAPTTTAPATQAAPVKPAPAPPASAPPASAPPASAAAPAQIQAPARAPIVEVVAKIQKFYEATSSLKARFNQSLSGPMGQRKASGQVILKKPGKMRWDYEKPEKKLFVADGTTLWMYEPEDEQAFRQPLSSSQLPAQVSFLFGRGKLTDEFEITYFDEKRLGEPGDLVLKLVPKKPTAQYRHLLFVVNPRTYVVKETMLFDQQGGTNDLQFSAIEQNPKSGVDDSRFSFTPPAGTKIINPSSQ